jgi:hypothetical protein
MKLIVSLPDNELSLARAAVAGGADAVKVHMNALHRASGASFGNYAQERERVLKLINEAGKPVGLMPGQQMLPAPAELTELIDAGLAFIDIYAHHLPAAYLELGKRAKLILAIERMHTEEEIEALSEIRVGGKRVVGMLETAIIPPGEYGAKLMAQDIALYHTLSEMSHVPLIVPTQKFITPHDLPALVHKNIDGIMIGVIVTGPTASGIEQITRRFRGAIDKLLTR